MKYHPRIYARAFLDTIERIDVDKRSTVFKSFFNILKRDKALARLDFILREIEKEELRRKGMKKIYIESSSKLRESLKKEIKNIFGGGCVFVERVKPEILAGVKILFNDEVLIDASARGLIEKMFKFKHE